MSMKPGVTRQLRASTRRRASPARPGPMATIRSPASATSADRAGGPVPSTTRPPRISPSTPIVGRLRLRGLDPDRLHPVAPPDRVHDVHPRDHLAEDRVLPVEVRGGGEADVELAPRTVGGGGAGPGG